MSSTPDYGRLTVVGISTYRGNSKKGEIFWICDCSCGATGLVLRKSDVRKGHTSSCGCLRKEITGAKRRTHGLSLTPTHNIWLNMLQRCNNPNRPDFKHYGGRGIRVCKRWYRFENFLEDMGEAPPGMSLDREKNHKGYNKKNCRWATKLQQANNTRTNVYLTHKGQTLSVPDWARLKSMPASRLHDRLRLGWSVEEALETPQCRTGGE